MGNLFDNSRQAPPSATRWRRRGARRSALAALLLGCALILPITERAIGFYSKLLPASSVVTSSPYWTELNVGGSTLALHLAEKVDHESYGMALAFDAATSLEDLVSTPRRNGRVSQASRAKAARLAAAQARFRQK